MVNQNISVPYVIRTSIPHFILRTSVPYTPPIMKSTISSLKQRIEALENCTPAVKDTTSASNLPNSNPVLTSDSPAPHPKVPDDHISTIVSTYLNEEKEKTKRLLNFIVHNLEESSSEDVATRQKYDTDQH